MINKPSLIKRVVKRTFDICSSGAVILVLLPLLIIVVPLIAIAMKGNPFFLQKRIGKNEKIFNIIKFRTMTNAKDANGNLLSDEKRLSKFGRILRATSVDELPELFNIFCGQMSVVGPRPLSLVYLPFYTAEQKQRHLVRPGLTGLAQINGRNNVSWTDRINYDLEYIKSMNLFFDLEIIFKTILKVLKKDDVVVLGSSVVTNLYDEYEMLEGEKNKEIGSDFIFGNEKKGDGLHIVTDKKNSILVNSGRNAIKVVIKKENATKVLLPIFTCDSVIKPFVEAKMQIEYYSLDKRLDICDSLMSQIAKQQGKTIVYLQNYFCNYNLDNLKKQLRKYSDVVIVEDITHSLLDNRIFKNADYYIGSIRKWAGVGEGGYVISDMAIDITEPNDGIIVNKLADIAVMQKQYAATKAVETKVAFREKLQEVEATFATAKVQNIAQSAKELVDSIDCEFIKKQRKDNYHNLWLMFSEFNIAKPIFGYEIGQSCPLYFPVYVENREKLQKYFAEKLIYCPIIWPKSHCVDGRCDLVSEYIYKHILCFPIDQRYNKDDMIKIFKVLEEYSQC